MIMNLIMNNRINIISIFCLHEINHNPDTSINIRLNITEKPSAFLTQVLRWWHRVWPLCSEPNWQLFVCFVHNLDVSCSGCCLLIFYNRQTLLEIGSTVTHHKPDFKFLNTTRCLQTTLCLGRPTTMPKIEPKERKESRRSRQIKTTHRPTTATKYPTG